MSEVSKPGETTPDEILLYLQFMCKKIGMRVTMHYYCINAPSNGITFHTGGRDISLCPSSNDWSYPMGLLWGAQEDVLYAILSEVLKERNAWKARYNYLARCV